MNTNFSKVFHMFPVLKTDPLRASDVTFSLVAIPGCDSNRSFHCLNLLAQDYLEFSHISTAEGKKYINRAPKPEFL